MIISYTGSALIKCGQCHQKLGLVHKEFIQSAATSFMQPFKSFLDTEMKALTVNILFQYINQYDFFSSRKNVEH